MVVNVYQSLFFVPVPPPPPPVVGFVWGHQDVPVAYRKYPGPRVEATPYNTQVQIFPSSTLPLGFSLALHRRATPNGYTRRLFFKTPLAASIVQRALVPVEIQTLFHRRILWTNEFSWAIAPVSAAALAFKPFDFVPSVLFAKRKLQIPVETTRKLQTTVVANIAAHPGYEAALSLLKRTFRISAAMNPAAGNVESVYFHYNPPPPPPLPGPTYNPVTPSLDGTFFFPVLPTVGWSVHKMPRFASIVQTPKSGREVTVIQQAYPFWEFTLTYEVLRDQTQNQSIFDPESPYFELQKIISLYLSCAAQDGWFFFSDPSDYSRAGAPIGVGDSVTETFTAYHYYGPQGFNDPLGAFQAISNVYFNGIAQSSSIYSFVGNEITFTSPPGAGVIITADYTFYYLCRFIEDSQDYEQFLANLWNLRSCKFRSVIR